MIFTGPARPFPVRAAFAAALLPVLTALPGTAGAELRHVRQAFFGDECGACARTVEREVADMAGVERVVVDPVRQVMTVELAADNRVTPARLEEALGSNGFRPRSTTVRVEGVLRRKGDTWFLQAGPLNRFRLESSEDDGDRHSGMADFGPGDRISIVGRLDTSGAQENATLTVQDISRPAPDE